MDDNVDGTTPERRRVRVDRRVAEAVIAARQRRGATLATPRNRATRISVGEAMRQRKTLAGRVKR